MSGGQGIEDDLEGNRIVGKPEAVIPAYGMAETTLAVSFSPCGKGLVVDEVDADLLAADILRGMDRNKALVVAPRSARVAWRAVRLAPGLSSAVGRLEMRYLNKLR